MSSNIDLHIVEGAQAGGILSLDPGKPLRLGRSGRGFALHDHLVSLSHAEISWEGDRYWIEDLGSVTGTYLNEERISEPTALIPGQRIRIGETVFEVQLRKRSIVLKLVGGMAALAALVWGVGYGAMNVVRGIEVSYDPKLLWHEPVRQGNNTSALIHIPMSFIRTYGVDHRGLKIIQVSDYDADGIDELWLEWDAGRKLITFGKDGGWNVLSDVPGNCSERTASVASGLPPVCFADEGQVKGDLPPECRAVQKEEGFPTLRCAGTSWTFTQGKGYEPIAQDGIVAWLPTFGTQSDPKDETITWVVKVVGPPHPYRFTLRRPGNLAGFLRDRGIEEPIHYLMCEGFLESFDAAPMNAAQVLTQSGRIIPLTQGCIDEFRLDGPNRVVEFARELPMAFAFTATGHQALLEDVEMFLAGGHDGLFIDKYERDMVKAVSEDPVPKVGSIAVTFDGPELPFDPIAAEGPLSGRRELMPSRFVPPAPPRSTTEVIFDEGVSYVDPPGCSELEVRTQEWQCVSRHGCPASSTFLTMRNVGCKDSRANKVSLTYQGGVARFEDAHVEARVVVESKAKGSQIDVLRTRVSYRLKEAETATEEDAPEVLEVEVEGAGSEAP